MVIKKANELVIRRQDGLASVQMKVKVDNSILFDKELIHEYSLAPPPYHLAAFRSLEIKDLFNENSEVLLKCLIHFDLPEDENICKELGINVGDDLWCELNLITYQIVEIDIAG